MKEPLTLVTGAAGWLGSTLVRRLVGEGRRVRALIYETHSPNVAHDLQSIGVDVVRGDVTNPASVRGAMDGVQRVFHLAGELHLVSAKQLHRINAGGTRTVAESAASCGVERFVYVSSITVHGHNISGGRPFHEEMERLPRGIYARTKTEGENIVRDLARTGKLPAVILRPGPFYGAGSRHGMKRLMGYVGQSPIPIFGDGRQLRSLVHIENCIDALLLAEDSHFCHGDAFLIGDSRPYSVLELLEEMANATGTKLRTFSIPPIVARMCERGTLFSEKSASLHLALPTMVSEFGMHTFCSISKARNELGYDPLRTLSDGLRDAAQER